MLCGIGLLAGLEWSRFALWVVALGAGALAFAALGVAVGALGREVRASSLLAFLLSLPMAFLALVPSGAVSGALFDVVQVVSALFPFKPALEATDQALNGGRRARRQLVHLAIQTVVRRPRPVACDDSPECDGVASGLRAALAPGCARCGARWRWRCSARRPGASLAAPEARRGERLPDVTQETPGRCRSIDGRLRAAAWRSAPPTRNRGPGRADRARPPRRAPRRRG